MTSDTEPQHSKKNPELALIVQQLQLANLEIENLQQRYSEDKHSWETMLNAMQDGSSPKRQCQDLQKALEKQRQENEHLSQQLKESLQKEFKANQILTIQKQSLQRELIQARQSVQVYQHEKLTLMLDKDHLARKLADLQTSYSQQSCQFHAQITQQQALWQAKQEEVQKLKMQLNQRSTKEVMHNEIKRVVEEQQRHVEMLQIRLDQQRENNKRAMQQLQLQWHDKMSIKQQQFDCEVQFLNAALISAKTQIVDSQANIQRMHDKLHAFERQALANRQQLEGEKDEQSAELLILKSKLKQFEHEKRQHGQQTQKLFQQKAELQCCLQQCEISVRCLHQSTHTLQEALRQKQEVLKGQQLRFQQRKSLLQQSLREMEQQHVQEREKLQADKEMSELAVKMAEEHLELLRKEKENNDHEMAQIAAKYKRIVERVQESKELAIQKKQEEMEGKLQNMRDIYEQDLDLAEMRAQQDQQYLHQQINKLQTQLQRLRQQSQFRLKQLQKENRAMCNDQIKDSSYAMDSMRSRVAELEKEVKRANADRSRLMEKLQSQKKFNKSMVQEYQFGSNPKQKRMLLDVSSLSSIHS